MESGDQCYGLYGGGNGVTGSGFATAAYVQCQVQPSLNR